MTAGDRHEMRDMRILCCRQERLLGCFIFITVTWVMWLTFIKTPTLSVPFSETSRRAVRKSVCPPAYYVPDIPEDSLYGRPVREAKTIMFNSVPKCGSRTLVWVFWDFVRQFQTPEPVYVEYMLDIPNYEKKKVTLREKVIQQERPAFIHGHYRYLELPEYERPVFASMIREPYARYISWYYFMRHGDADMNKTALLKQLGPRAARANETLDDCFANKRHDCRDPFYYELNIRLFCGYDPKCDTDQKYALKRAKENLEKYLVIGLMEEYEDTVKVMEKLMPSMFGGAVQTYRDMLAQSAEHSKTFYKKYPSKETEDYLKDKLKYDLEFYEYVKERFHKLKNKLGIGSTSEC